VRSFLLFLGMLAPATVFAAETSGGAHGPAWGVLVAAIFNAIVLVVILIRATGRPLRNFLIQRSRAVARAIDEANQRLREAEREVERWKERLANVDAEAGEVVRAAAELAELERQRRFDRARATADRIRLGADTLAQQEVAQAREALREEVADLAASGAAALVRELIRAEDDRRLIVEYADRIEEAT
jgi:F-type H+-transporting ATPase subunit b